MRLWALCAATWVSRAGFQSSTGEQSRWSQCPRHILRDSLPLCSVGGCFPTRSAEDVLCVALLCLQEGSGGEAEGESSSVEVEEGRRKAPLPICASSALAAPLPLFVTASPKHEQNTHLLPRPKIREEIRHKKLRLQPHPTPHPLAQPKVTQRRRLRPRRKHRSWTTPLPLPPLGRPRLWLWTL